MLSLRQSLTKIGKPTTRIPSDLSMPCKSLRDTLISWNYLVYPLLIIAPQEFVESVRPLADHKNRTGIATMLISLEHIYQVYPGRDEAEKVKQCLALFKRYNDVRYAMLVGDVDKFPARFTKWWWRRDNSKGEDGKYKDPLYESDPEFHTIFVPEDLYYAALFKESNVGPSNNHSFDDWDGNRDNYFGEVPAWGDFEGSGTGPINPDDVHAIPHIAVGRIPASSVDQVRVYVDKVIAYENGAFGSSWANAALLVCGDHSDKTALLNLIASDDLRGYVVHKLYVQGGTEGPTPKKTWASLINTYMNPPEGVNFVAYMGHGNFNGWAIDAGKLGIDGWYAAEYNDPNNPNRPGDLDGLKNSDRLPVVFSTGCYTGDFATQPPMQPYRDINGNDHKGTYDGEIFSSTPPQPACLQTADVESLAEGMTVLRRTGAIAYIGNTHGSWEGGAELLKFFFESLAHDKTLGDMWLEMLERYNLKYKPPFPARPAKEVSNEDYAMILEPWHLGLFGDPSLRVGGIPS